MKIILDYNRTIFNPDTDNLYPGVFELLQRLATRHKLYLISRNEPSRKNRLEELDIEKYFQKMFFVNKKSKSIFKKIIDNEEKVMVVGDSITNEIKIGNQLNLLTVRVRTGIFSTQTPQEKDEDAKYEITNINELEKIIKKL